jgi:hypothetical protein
MGANTARSIFNEYILRATQFILKDDEHRRFALWCTADINPILSRWAYFEARRQKSQYCSNEDQLRILNDSIVDLYIHILKYLLDMVRYISSSTPGLSISTKDIFRV